MGMLFIFDRVTGEPVFPIEERPVPQSTVPGEETSPTQPFPVKPPPLAPHELLLDNVWGLTPWDRKGCRAKLEAAVYEGIYTPPGLNQGTINYPGTAGGSNWGGVAVDPERQLVLANVMNLAWVVSLVPAEEFDAARQANPGVEFGPQRGTPYGMRREMLMSMFDLPCNPPPWGTLAAVDLESGDIAWQVNLGTIRDLAPIPLGLKLGVPSLGGPIVTASGLVFIAATVDDYLRAFDVETGEELWRGRLPAGGQATPMTYRLSETGKQYVVIAAGGHGRAETTLGDAGCVLRGYGPGQHSRPVGLDVLGLPVDRGYRPRSRMRASVRGHGRESPRTLRRNELHLGYGRPRSQSGPCRLRRPPRDPGFYGS
jgi:quinoprotein glucose dehydrogenase